MKRWKNIWFLLSAGLFMAGCSANSQGYETADASEPFAAENDRSDEKNADINKYSLSGTALTLAQMDEYESDTALDNAYIAYTDEDYVYYFDENLENLRYLVSKNQDIEPEEVESQVLIDQSEDYLEQISSDLDISADDWSVTDLSVGMYTLDLHQEIYGEDIVIASFHFIGDQI